MRPIPPEAAVAIDSLQVTRDPTTGAVGERHEVCKVTILNDHSVFVVEGVAGSSNGFDAGVIASELFSVAGNDIDEIAKQWGAEMAMKIGAKYPNNQLGIDDFAAHSNGVVANGLFITQTDVMHAVRSGITHRVPGSADFSFFIEPVAYGSAMSAGHFEFAWPALAEARKRWGANTPDDWAAALDLVATRLRDSNIDPFVGGEIATIILDRGKSLRCYHQPPACAQNRR
jgi:hypothetical protein